MNQKQQSRESGSETGCAASEQQSTGAAEALLSRSQMDSIEQVYQGLGELVDFAEVLEMAHESVPSEDRAPCLERSLSSWVVRGRQLEERLYAVLSGAKHGDPDAAVSPTVPDTTAAVMAELARHSGSETIVVERLSPIAVITELQGMVALAQAVRIAAPSQTPSERCSAWSFLVSRFGEVLGRSQEMARGGFSDRARVYIGELEDALRLIAPALPSEGAR